MLTVKDATCHKLRKGYSTGDIHGSRHYLWGVEGSKNTRGQDKFRASKSYGWQRWITVRYYRFNTIHDLDDISSLQRMLSPKQRSARSEQTDEVGKSINKCK